MLPEKFDVFNFIRVTSDASDTPNAPDVTDISFTPR